MTRIRRWLLALAAFACLLATAYALRERMLPLASSWLDVGQPPRRAECVVVLGGDVYTRPFVAAAIVKAGLVRKVLVAHVGGSADVDPALYPPQHEVATRVLLARGVPRADIGLLGRENRSTYDEARALGEYLQSRPRARVLVVTHGYHTRRTRWVFAQVLGGRIAQVTFVSAPVEEYHAERWWRSEAGFTTIVGENLKLLAYFFAYSATPYLGGAAMLWIGRRLRRFVRWKTRMTCCGTAACSASPPSVPQGYPPENRG